MKVAKWIIAREKKNHFAVFVKDSNSAAGFFSFRAILLGTHRNTSHKHALAGFKMAASEVEFWASLVTDLLRIPGNF